MTSSSVSFPSFYADTCLFFVDENCVKGPCGAAAARAAGNACSPVDAEAISNLRRTSGDVKDNWDSITRILEDAAAVVQYSHPGYFGVRVDQHPLFISVLLL